MASFETNLSKNTIGLLTATERAELLTEGGVSPLGDGEDGADEVNFNFRLEGGMTLPCRESGTGSPSRAR